MAKTIKITLTDETAYYVDFLVAEENLRYPRVLFERLVNKEIKKRKMGDRPTYAAPGIDEGDSSNA